MAAALAEGTDYIQKQARPNPGIVSVVVRCDETVDATNTLVLTVKQLQNFNEFPIYKLPVDVAIWDETGKTNSRIVVDSVEQNFYFPIKGTVKNVLFDEPQMLLGKVFEDKSTDEFIHQYYNAKRWKARNTALARVANIPGDKSARLLADALKDPFWSIRLSAINVIEKMEKEKAKTYVSQLKEMSLNDAKSDVRAAAIGCMEFMEADEATTFFKSFMAKEKSYTAIASGLGSYIKVDEKDALNVARGMKNEPAKALKVTIAEVIAQIGDSSDYDYLDQLIYHSDFKGYDELRTMISYAVYIMRMNIDLQEKSHAVYIHYNEVGGDLTKYWVKQAVQFNLQNYMQLVNSLEMEIAELEEGKSFAKADEKKRIKQRYDDLIQNLLPLGQSDEAPEDTEGN
jgi:hypothetical protein